MGAPTPSLKHNRGNTEGNVHKSTYLGGRRSCSSIIFSVSRTLPEDLREGDSQEVAIS